MKLRCELMGLLTCIGKSCQKASPVLSLVAIIDRGKRPLHHYAREMSINFRETHGSSGELGQQQSVLVLMAIMEELLFEVR